MNLGACPHCGYKLGVYQAVRITGQGKRRWKDTEDEGAIDIPRLKLMPYSDAVRCASCRHIRRDWQAIDGELVRGEWEG